MDPVSCSNSISRTNNIKINNVKIGNQLKKNKFPAKRITQLNPTITFKRVWPAIMFANNRIDKLIGLNKKEINSIGINKRPR
jgi:hypothetical protein